MIRERELLGRDRLQCCGCIEDEGVPAHSRECADTAVLAARFVVDGERHVLPARTGALTFLHPVAVGLREGALEPQLLFLHGEGGASFVLARRQGTKTEAIDETLREALLGLRKGQRVHDEHQTAFRPAGREPAPRAGDAVMDGTLGGPRRAVRRDARRRAGAGRYTRAAAGFSQTVAAASAARPSRYRARA